VNSGNTAGPRDRIGIIAAVYSLTK
jgi:hypothetical protein